MAGWLRCAFIRLFVCVFILPWCLLCGHMPMERVWMQISVFFVAWGGVGFGALSHHGSVCTLGSVRRALPVSLGCRAGDVS